MTLNSAFIDHLTTIAPSPARNLESFAIDSMRPAAAIAPLDRSAAAAALQAVAAECAVTVPWGGGVQQEMGYAPSRYDVALSTENMARLIDYQPGDLTVTVEGGATLAALQEILAQHGQFVALESRDPDRETIGGLLAVGSSALLRCAYGPPRDQVIGMAVAMPDGSVIHAGGRVVKNVAGYDLCKLFTGSLGTLGVIVEATFRVRPKPQKKLTWIGAFISAAETESALAALMDSALQPSFLQMACPDASGSMGSFAKIDGIVNRWSLIIGADGDDPLTRWMVDEASKLTSPRADKVIDGAASDRVRQWLVQRCGPQGHLCSRVCVLSSEITALVEDCRCYCLETGVIKMQTIAAAANGVCYINFRSADKTNSGRPVWARLVEWLTQEVDRRDGTCAILRCPPEIRNQLPLWGASAPTWPLMQRIRQTFDPHYTLNRGRMFRECEEGVGE
ncbi:MAG TPA: FAD-binding oxidoreductase [Armatimonadota bacterium]|nr:FAD-binding oxidoreductase [Armatimonadota bacterium]